MIPPRSVLFGTEGKMSWIKAPAINVGMSKGKWTSSGVMLNGGAYELSSNYAHRKFDFAWNLMSPEEVRKITRYFDGVYGDELLYYLDPFAMNSNVLPLSWSVPMLAADDAPPLILDQVPTLSTVATNTNDLPVRAATYTLSAGYVSDTVFIPVPDGEGLNIGVVGSRTGTAAVTFTPKTGSAVSPILTAIGSTNLITNYMTNTGGGVTVSLTGLGTITLVAMQARVSPNEISAPFVTTNLFTNPSFETPVNRPKLSAWRTAFNTGSVQIVAIGDSITEGTGASTVTNRWQTILQTELRGGATGATFPFIPAWPQSSVTGFPVTRAGNVGQNSTTTAVGLGWRGADLRDDTAVITFTFTGDRCKAMVYAASAAGVMSVQIDGGTPVLVNTQSPAMPGGQQTWDSGALTNGAHTVVIRRSATSPAGNFVYLQGLLTYNGDLTSGVRVLDASRHGINSAFVTSARATGLGGAVAAAGGAKLAIIGLGTNDYSVTTSSAFKSNIEILIAGLRSNGFTGSILLLGMYLGGGRDNATWSTYLDQYAAIASADANIDYLDLRTVMPSVPTPFDDPTGEGLYADFLHPNNSGYARIRSAIMPYLVDAVSGVTGGYRATDWSADSTHSLRVESEQTATVSVTGPVVITARNSGQSATLAGTTVTSTSANQTLTLTGSGTLILGAGWWDKLGDGITSWFSGATPSTGDTTYAWTGTANASTSTKTTSVPSPNAKQGFIPGEGHSGLRLSGVANISGYSAPSALNLQSISATLTEVGAWEPQ